LALIGFQGLFFLLKLSTYKKAKKYKK